VAKTREIHYLFVESLSKPETDPIIVIFNGGPGGAAVGMAF
jgi:carboxypeptidase C (cathepsin A)